VLSIISGTDESFRPLQAKKLHIHRNTLYHRLKKISEITNMDLDSGDDYLKLLLSFKIMELYSISVRTGQSNWCTVFAVLAGSVEKT